MNNKSSIDNTGWVEFQDDIQFELDTNIFVEYKSEVHHMDYSEYGSIGDDAFEQVLDVRIIMSIGDEKFIVPLPSKARIELVEILEERLTNLIREDY